MTKNQQGFYINSLSSIPMFEQGKVTGKNFYNTSYHADYPKKQRLLDRQTEYQKNADFSTYNNYDYKMLSERLEAKEKSNSSRSEFVKNQFNSNSLDNFNTESRFAFSGTGQVYKRPHIPDYTKRDNFFQTNQEKNISYVTTHDGKLMPFVPSEDLGGFYLFKRMFFFKRTLNKSRSRPSAILDLTLKKNKFRISCEL